MTNSLHRRIICYVLEVAMFQLPGTHRIHKRRTTQISYTAAGTISQSWRVSLLEHQAERESGINNTLHACRASLSTACGFLNVNYALGPPLGRWSNSWLPKQETRLKGCRSRGLRPLGHDWHRVVGRGQKSSVAQSKTK